MAIIPSNEKVFMVSNGTNTTYSGSAALKAMQQWYTMQDVIDTVGGGGGVPTLDQVVAEGNTVTNNRIIINSDSFDGPAGVFYSASDGITGLEAASVGGIAISGSSTDTGVVGEGAVQGVLGNGGTNGIGVKGVSGTGHGVYGVAEENGSGVKGVSTGGIGGEFTSATGYGVYASAQGSAAGVYGEGSAFGVVGYTPAGIAISGDSETGTGVQGNTYTETIGSTEAGVYGWGAAGIGVKGQSSSGYGVKGTSLEGVGGYFISNTTYALVADGTAAKPGGGSWSALSDARVKENVVPYTKGLSDILLINPVNYEYNGLANTTKGAKYTGIIAQEIKEIFPDTVSTYTAKLNEEDEEKTELYDFNASELVFALINAVKELKAEIDLLKSV